MDNMFEIFKAVIQKSFQENFEKYRDKKILIYGTGDIARFILAKFSDYNIIGFLDGNISSGTKLGKRIFSYEEAVEHKPDIVIVAAKKDHIKAVYDRICYMCHTNKIQLYSVDGRNLFTAFGYGGLTAEQESYREINESMLKEEILKHDIVSFDIFDVLIMRKTLLKSDVLDIVEDRLSGKGLNIPGYKELRQRLEEEVLAEGGNIYDIYERLIGYSGITGETAEKALAAELAIEDSIICCRERMKEMLLFALQRGKKVYLIEDTYFPQATIESMLKRQEISQYDGLFLSCEYKKTKAKGLYGILKSEAKGQTYLHIGTSCHSTSDYEQDGQTDIFTIPSAYDMLLMSSYRNLQYCLKSVNERSMAGMLAARVFNDPFSLCGKEGRPEIDSIHDFGYVFVAPIITKFVLWLIEKVKNGQYEDVLFAARDGYLVHKLYGFALQVLDLSIPKGIYFQTSRILCTNSVVKAEEDIVWNANTPHAKAPEMMLADRFNLGADQIEQYNEEKYPDVLTYALHHKEKIYKKSEAVRNNYLKYMEHIGLQKDKKYAFVDFVSCGTCQQTLNKLIYFDIEGLYFCKYGVENKEKMELTAQALFENLYEEYVYCSYAYEKYLLLESIMTSLQPSLASMDENGQPIFREEVRSREELQYVADNHSAIEDYFYDYISNLYVNGPDINKHFTDVIFSYREQKYTNEHCSAFDNLILLEDFGQWRMLLDRNY